MVSNVKMSQVWFMFRNVPPNEMHGKILAVIWKKALPENDVYVVVPNGQNPECFPFFFKSTKYYSTLQSGGKGAKEKYSGVKSLAEEWTSKYMLIPLEKVETHKRLLCWPKYGHSNLWSHIGTIWNFFFVWWFLLLHTLLWLHTLTLCQGLSLLDLTLYLNEHTTRANFHLVPLSSLLWGLLNTLS